MKTFLRFFVPLMIVMSVLGLQVTSVKADEQPFEFNQTEQDVRTEILAGKEVDLAGQTIRGEALVAMWKDPALTDISYFKIKNAVIDGNIDAEGISLPFMVGFVHCTFNGDINLESAKTKTFQIENDSTRDDPAFPAKINAPSTINGSLRMSRMIVNGDVGLYKSIFNGGVTLFDAHVDNNLYAKGSSFLSIKPVKDSAYAFELWTIYVGEKTEFAGSTFKGYVMAENAEFGEEVDFEGSIFEKTANFKNFKVGNYANFQSAVFKDEAIFESGVADRDAAFTGATFDGHANFNYFTSTRFMDLDGVTFHDFDFTYTNIGWPYFESSTFNGRVDFEGMETPNDFDFTNAKYSKTDGPFKIYDTKVGGRVLFKGFSAPAGLNLANNQFGSLNITGNDQEKFDLIKLDATNINGELYIQDVNVDDFSAQDMSVKNSTAFMNMSVMKKLNLSNASLGSFTIGDALPGETLKPFWPSGEDADFRLLGTTYSDIRFAALKTDQPGNVGESQVQDHNYKEPELEYHELNSSKKNLLGDMVTASAYSPQAYQTLEQFFTAKGRSSWSADLEYKRKERERTEILALDKNSTPYLRSWFLWRFSGYGQHPEYALRWGMVIVVLGAVFFHFTGAYTIKEDNKKDENSKAAIENNKAREIIGFKKFAYCLLYSAALFFPLSVLKFAESWEPASDRSYFKLYQLAHRILGMIITPTAVLAFGGWIK